jgi:hypothetical protein
MPGHTCSANVSSAHTNAILSFDRIIAFLRLKTSDRALNGGRIGDTFGFMSDGNPIVVSVKLDFWDAYRGAIAVIVRRFRKFLAILALAVCAIVIVLILASFQPAREGEWERIQSNLAPFLLFLGIFICFLFLTPLLSARKALADGSAGGAEYRFSDAGVYIQGPAGSADLRWAAFPTAVETNSAFLLFSRIDLAHTIPKRCYVNPDDITIMRELLRSHIPKATLRR